MKFSFEQGIAKARELGHDLQDDPPAISRSTSRHTCTKCGRAVLSNSNFAYGSAMTDVCKGDSE